MWELALPAAITAIVGWMVKSLLDAVRDYAADSHRWRMGLDAKIDTIMGATQTTMRATLIHNYEKYAERGWLTPEEPPSVSPAWLSDWDCQQTCHLLVDVRP